jgi:ACS family D-galactonate transporter-like MFS transporter
MPEAAEDSRQLARFTPALILLAISYLINYVDRGNLGIAAPLLKGELGLSDAQLGVLLSAFFPTYTAMQFLIGWLVDRFDANRILAIGFLLWSLATAITGFVHGFVLLLAMRFVLGIGESVALPTGSKILCQHLPEHHRGFASGILMSALRWGNAVGSLGAGLMMAKFGWRPVFIFVGLVSLIWLPAWMRWMPRNGHRPTNHDANEPRSLDILLQRSFWGTSAGHFACNYLFYFMITWLPSYLVRERHLSMQSMAGIAGLYYAVDAGSAIISGWAQDHALRKGYSATVVRKSAMAIGFSLAAVAVFGCAVAGRSSYLPWLLAAGVGCGMVGPGIFTFPQRLAGQQAVGRWYGFQNGFANLAGFGPAITGLVLQYTHSFHAPFFITSAICAAGVVAWVFVVGRVEQVDWSSSQPASAVAADVGA